MWLVRRFKRDRTDKYMIKGTSVWRNRRKDGAEFHR